MSLKLIVDALSAKVGSSARKFVLVKLADNANDMGECWPSYKHIADHCEMSRRTVITHINKLEEDGFLRIEHRKGPKGNTSNIFHLTISEGLSTGPKISTTPSAEISLPSAEISPPSENIAPPPSENIAPRTCHSFETVNEPLKEYGSSAKNPSSNKFSYPDEFDFIWQNRPRRQGADPKKPAYHACVARLKEGHTWEELQSGMNVYSTYLTETGQMHTPFVQQMKRFFGPEKGFMDEWIIINTGAVAQLKPTQFKQSAIEQLEEKIANFNFNDDEGMQA